MEAEFQFECAVCREKYASVKDLECHWTVHFQHSALERPEEVEKPKPSIFECDKCKFKAKLSFALKLHIRDKHCEKTNEIHPYVENLTTSATKRKKIAANKCPKCEYQSTRKCKLQRHIKVVHDKIKDHHCKVCEYKARDICRLQRHVESVHVRTKSHKCPKCDFAAARKDNLTQHIRAVHDKIKDVSSLQL